MERMVLTPKEAAEVMHTSLRSLMDRLASGEIPAYRDGVNWKIPVDLLRKTLEEQAIKETNERR